MMRLQRKIFVKPEYYKDLGLNEFEENWLRKKRSKLAKKYWKESIEKSPDKKPELIKNLTKDLRKAERDISGGKVSTKPYEIVQKDPKRIGRYIKEAVNSVGDRKKKEAQVIEKELALKLRADRIELAEKLKKQKNLKKNIGKGAVIVGGTALGVGLGMKAISDHKKNKKKKETKEAILKK